MLFQQTSLLIYMYMYMYVLSTTWMYEDCIIGIEAVCNYIYSSKLVNFYQSKNINYVTPLQSQKINSFMPYITSDLHCFYVKCGERGSRSWCHGYGWCHEYGVQEALWHSVLRNYSCTHTSSLCISVAAAEGEQGGDHPLIILMPLQIKAICMLHALAAS